MTRPEELIDAVAPVLQMPDAMPGLIQIVANLEEMEPCLETLVDADTVDLLRQWLSAVAAIPADDPLRQDPHLTEARYRQGKIIAPTHMFKTEAPVWCALWPLFGGDDLVGANVYRWLQAHYLAAHIRDDRGEVDGASSERWRQAGIFVRKVHQPDNMWLCYEVADAVQDEWLMCRTLAALRGESRAAGKNEPLLDQAGAYAELLSDVFDLGIKVFDERRGGSGGSGRGGAASKCVDAMSPDHSGYWYLSEARLLVSSWGTATFMVHRGSSGRQKREEFYQSGIYPDEYDVEASAEIDTASLVGLDEEEPQELGQLPELAALFAAARARARRIAMEAQRLRVEPNRIRVAEIAALVNTMQALFLDNDANRYRRLSVEQRREMGRIRETLLLGGISLMTGIEPKRARNVLIIQGVRELPVGYLLAYNPAYRMWLRPHEPPSRHPFQGAYRSHTRETWPRVVFEDVFGVGERLAEYADRCRDAGTKRFRHQDKKYEQIWNEQVAPRLAAAGVRKSWRRFAALASVLPHVFAGQEEGEHLVSRLLFGLNDPMSSTQQYYTTWQRADLAHRYHQQVSDLWKRLPLDESTADSLFAYRAAQTPIDDSWVGDDRTPVSESVTELIGLLRDRVRAGAQGQRDRLKRHNDLAIYTALGLLMITGARAVRTPFPDLRSIHYPTGTLAMQEKDRTDGTHARLAVLPWLLIEQVDAYLGHLMALYRDHPGMPDKLRVPATKYRDKAAYNDSRYTLELNRTLFLVDIEGSGGVEPLEITGNRVKNYCDWIKPGHWPVENAGRHFLRSSLIERGCPATLVNAHLGHWNYGEEPWAGASGMDPVRYRQALRPYLEQIMQDINYRVARG